MRATLEDHARELDLLFVAREHGGHLTEARLTGPADPVMEVSFDDSVATGRVSRTAAYLALGLFNFHKDSTVFEDPYITGGFRDDNGNSLSHRGNTRCRYVA